jgi:methylated-DNA-protein-cysteine methyltransferase-like protein
MIYAVVRSIPRGKVATYGEVAELAGLPLGHRVVARAMRSCPERFPWQRVVGKKDARRAQINIADPEPAFAQRALLQAEGVVFDDSGFILLRRSGWLPRRDAEVGPPRAPVAAAPAKKRKPSRAR